MGAKSGAQTDIPATSAAHEAGLTAREDPGTRPKHEKKWVRCQEGKVTDLEPQLGAHEAGTGAGPLAALPVC